MTFAQLKANIAINLNDTSKVYFTNSDIDISMAAAYSDITALIQCIIKKVTLDWQNDLSYYDFKADFAVTDYLATIAIFNNVNRKWLQDDMNLSNLDRINDRWELQHGTPNWWCFAALNKTAIYPKKAIATGNFDLYYWATNPSVSDGSSPLVAADFQKLFEMYSTADLLEQAEEYMKAGLWWSSYFKEIENYKERTKELAKADFRLYL